MFFFFQYGKDKNFPVLKEKAYKRQWKYTSTYSSFRHWIGVDKCNIMSTYPPPCNLGEKGPLNESRGAEAVPKAGMNDLEKMNLMLRPGIKP